ncbi:MAG: septum formation initiator family protein [Actinomyces ruminicola]|uniref:Cell division protein FtsB n=1 Tax=Actinomyces ruminicola TaxID=332524 RepID=A0A1H0DHK9_9ACTO|nr:septum formation initiator family protein [Actinomyces ruminicola]MBE6480905.1 septum formation initiator family protein [Actinomyces ruminicola]SDN69506.1 Cell division protein FtsB [Actinomyces ruminicola]
MTPRRPVPARPGARRPRSGPSHDARASAGRHTDKPDTARAAVADTGHNGVSASAGDDSENLVPRMGGAEGLSLPMRLLILAGVLALAFVVVFPSLRGYLTQRAQYDAVLDQIDEARATSTALEEELARWEDDEYVKTQARERLSYVMPGETTYVVVGADSFEDDDGADPSPGSAEERSPWYQELRESARVAGQVEEEEVEDPARQGWSTPSPQTTATPGATATPSASATPSVDSGDQ